MGYQEQLIVLIDQCQHVWLQLQSNNSIDNTNSRKDLRDSIKQLVQLQDNYEDICTSGNITLWEKQAQQLLQQVSQRIGTIVKANPTLLSTDDNHSIEPKQQISNRLVYTPHKQEERDLDALPPPQPHSFISTESTDFSHCCFTNRPLPSASTPWSSREEHVGYDFRKLSLDDHEVSPSPPEHDTISISTSTTTTSATMDDDPATLVKSNSNHSMYSLQPHIIDTPPQHTRMDLIRPMGRYMADILPDIGNKTERRSKLSLSLPFKKINASYSSPTPGALAQINFYKDDGNRNVDGSFASDAIVDHPLRIGVGYGSYICYSCTVFSNKGTPITIRKRYSDFVHIRQQLIKLFPTSMMSLPKLPPKKIVKKFDPIFVEQRRRDLEYFFKYIVLHPTLGSSSIVKQWIAP